MGLESLLGGFDPLSMGLNFAAGTINKVNSGQGIGKAALQSLPLIGNIFANSDLKAKEAHAAKGKENSLTRFAQGHASNIPMRNGGVMLPITENPMLGGQLQDGGYMDDGGRMDLPQLAFNTFDGGGTHEQNPLGGIPMPNGKSVEQGESKYKFDDGDYVFSDTLKY